MADTFVAPIDIVEVASTPANPPSGYRRLYAKSDGKSYQLTATGVETELSNGAGGGASTLNDLTDVDTSGVVSGNVLQYNGALWVPVVPAGGASTTYGEVDINFGSGSGNNLATTIITGQAGVLNTSKINVWINAYDSTTDHTDYHHMMVPIKATISAISTGVGFTIRLLSDIRLTGNFKVRWSWQN